MEKEHFDPVYGYIDNKIKLLKRELKQLKIAHDTLANKHEKMLLDIQTTIVAWDINSSVDTYGEIIGSQLSHRNDLITQLVADAVNAKKELLNSEHPFDIGLEFKNKWRDKLENLGAKMIKF